MSAAPATSAARAFARRFGRAHVALALHASVPLGLTPELLHLIRINFVPQAPWMAEADLLLSSLCHDTGGGFYQMEPATRETLLDELRFDPAFGNDRLRGVASLLVAHAGRELPAVSDAEEHWFLLALELTGLAYLDPGAAAEQFAAALKQGLEGGQSDDVLRVARLAEELAAPLAGEEKVLLYAAGVSRLRGGAVDEASRWFEAAGSATRPVRIGSVELPAPSRLLPSGGKTAAAAAAAILTVMMPLDLGEGVRMEFVWVPPGTFWMGGGGGSPGDKQVEITERFGLGVYPVTQEQWQEVMGNNPSYFSRTGDGKDRVKDVSDADLRQFPVEWVSWEDVVNEFLVKLNEREKASGWLYRLPTAVEWEYSCRGGLTSKDECSFHFYFDKPSDDLSSREANFDGNYPDGAAAKGPNLERTTKVGSYRPNRLGLYDMHGNVWEWCRDWYTEGSSRVVRGGGWHYHGSGCRAANRDWSAPSDRYYSLGFRLARVPSSS